MTPLLKEYYGKSIRIAPDGFSFYKEDGKRLTVKTFPHSSNALITTEAPSFFNPDTSLDIIASQQVPMLIPTELFAPAKVTEYLALQFDTSRLGRAYNDPLGEYQAVYFLSQNVMDTIGRLPFTHQVVSETTLTFRMLQQLNAAAAISVGLNNGFFDVAVVHKGAPQLANRFPMTEPTDILYYLLNIIRQLNLRSPEVLLHFHEEADKKLLQLLKTYKLKPIILQ